MSFIERLKGFVRPEDEFGDLGKDTYDEPPPRAYGPPPPERKVYGIADYAEPLPRRAPPREPLSRERERERENVIPLRASEAIKRITAKFNIVVIEPQTFDECPQLVDSLKSKKPVIINLANIENNTARKIFDFLAGATYAVNGNVQKIAQSIFVFLPENVDVQIAEPPNFRPGQDRKDRWR